MDDRTRDKERGYYWVAARIGLTLLGPQVQRHSDIINNKIAAVLINISIMTAVSIGVETSPGNSTLITMLLLLAILLYIIFAVIAMRAVFVTTNKDFPVYEKDASDTSHFEEPLPTNAGRPAVDAMGQWAKPLSDHDYDRIIEANLDRFISVVRERRATLNTSIHGTWAVTIFLLLTLILRFFWQT